MYDCLQLPQLTTPSLSTRNALNSSKFEGKRILFGPQDDFYDPLFPLFLSTGTSSFFSLIVEETDNDDGSTSFVSKVVQPTGPPVKAAKSKLTVFQVDIPVTVH